MNRILLQSIVLFFLAIMFCGCGSNVKGKVYEKFTGKPIQSAIVVATMKTNIAEDKRYEFRKATTDSKGEFKISGLSPKYSYTIKVSKSGYFSLGDSNFYFTPPEKGKTRIIEKPLKLIKRREIKGKVFDTISGKPISEVSVSATCTSNVGREYNAYKQRQASTNAKGEFFLPPLIPSAKYNIIIGKKRYSYKSIHFSTPGNITHLSDFSLILIPANHGAYIIENSQYLPLKISKKRYKVLKAGSDNQICSFIYFRKNDLSNVPVLKTSSIKKLAILAPQNSIRDFRIYPLFLFNKLTTLYWSGVFGEYEAQKFFKDRNIYLAAQKVNNDNSRISAKAYYQLGKKFREVLEKNRSIRKTHSWCSDDFKGILAHTRYNTDRNSIKFILIDLSYLKSGYYLFWVGDRSYLYYFK